MYEKATAHLLPIELKTNEFVRARVQSFVGPRAGADPGIYVRGGGALDRRGV